MLSIENKAPARRRGFTWAHPPGIDWWLCCLALAGLEFLQYSQTLAACTPLPRRRRFARSGNQGGLPEAVYRGGLIWFFVALWLMSTLWSPVPDQSLRSALQVILTVGAALIMVRALPAASFMTALMCALLTATAASLMDRQALNYGGLAMIGIYGSKNQFGLSQALLLMVSVWVFMGYAQTLDGSRLRRLGNGPRLCPSDRGKIAGLDGGRGRRADLLHCAFKLNRFAPRWRALILVGLISLIMIVSVFLLIFGEALT